MTILTYDTLDAVPEGLREVAKQSDDDKYEVKVAPAGKVTEFRDTNIALAKERDAVAARNTEILAKLGIEEFTDDFITELGAIRETAKRVADGELVENKGLTEAVSERTAEMRASYEEQIKTVSETNKALTQRNNELQQRNNQGLIEKNIVAALSKKTDLGLAPTAVPDVMERALRTFKVEDGRPIPKQGDAILYGQDGTSPMTPEEWLDKLLIDAPHFFQNSGGGNASGADEHGKVAMSYEEQQKIPAAQRLQMAREGKI